MTSAIMAIYKREFAAYFNTPLAYVFIIIFIVLQGVMAFYAGQFFEREQADLSSFFAFHPWLYLFLIPAIGMRLWSEERASGTMELLLTLPISPGQAIVGKYLAALSFAGLALSLTFPMWITVAWLGDPDHGAIVTGYIGSFLMAGAYLSIATAMSAVSRNQVVAFILSATACFLMTVTGLPFILDLAVATGSETLVSLIAGFSFLSHFDALQKGVLVLGDIGFFSIMIAFWLTLARIIINMKREDG